MKANNQLIKKLSAYSLFAGAFLAAEKSDAQILYTDVAPDDTLNINETFALDLNNDGLTDFIIAEGRDDLYYWTGGFIFNQASAINSIAGIATDTGYSGSIDHYAKLPYKLGMYSPINSGVNWVPPVEFNPYNWNAGSNVQPFAMFNFIGSNGAYLYGYWINGVVDGYAGLRINLNGDYYYGWIRLDVDSAAKWMIIKDYALNSAPNATILAGQCLCPPTIVEEAKSLQLIIHPNPATDKIFLSSLNGRLNGGEALVFDLSGRTIFSQKISSEENIIDVSALAEGIYLLELKNENQTVVNKFEVKR